MVVTSKRKKGGWDKKLLYIVAVFVILASSIIAISYFGNKVVDGTRAFIGGEGHWSKAQKKAILYLTRYVNRGEVQDYERFKNELNVIKGDSIGRTNLSPENYNYQKSFQGFLQGKVHPDDIPSVIWLYDNFRDVRDMNEAIQIWKQAEIKILALSRLASEIHNTMQQDELTAERSKQFIDQIYAFDEELTVLEEQFSRSIGKAARWGNSIVFWSTLSMVLVLMFIGGGMMVKIMQDIRTMNERLRKKEREFRNVLGNSRDVLYQMNLETGAYEFMSSSVKQMLGYTNEEIIEKGPEFIVENVHPEDRQRMNGVLEDIKKDGFEEDFEQDVEFRIKTKKGDYIWISNRRTLCLDEEGQPDVIVGSVRDVSDRKANEEKIGRSLEEKEVLLKEIHHRVKNNLAVISGLLELQKGDVPPGATEALNTSQSRIHSIAMVHEKLYQSQTLANVSMREYINEFVDTLESAYESESRSIEIEKDLDEVTLEITDAVPCGLLLNELLNNAFKHAFKGKKEGKLRIKLQKEGSGCIISVADNGRGLPKNFDEKEDKTLGMNLIRTLSNQLKGDLEINSNGWTEFKISFNYQ